jgi:hypothetical protein
MGHFTINLPGNQKGDVRSGTTTKVSLSFFRKSKVESRNGYLVKIAYGKNQAEYRLFKSKNGEWSKDPDGKADLDDNILVQIKNAIIEKENQPARL